MHSHSLPPPPARASSACEEMRLDYSQPHQGRIDCAASMSIALYPSRHPSRLAFLLYFLVSIPGVEQVEFFPFLSSLIHI